MWHMFDKFLEELGLSDKEAKVYLALLEVDNDSVVDLSKRTSINRTTIYPVLESLSKKGLVSEVKIDKKVRFSAEPPERLETYIERKKIQLGEQEKRLKDIIPQIKGIQKESGEKPVIKYFEGKEGILHANEEYLKTTSSGKDKTMYIIYPKGEVDSIFSESDLKRFRKNRVRNDIKSKSVFTYPEGEYESTKDSNRLKIDHKKYPLSTDISVYEDNVKISTLGKRLSSIIIKNVDLADTLKSLINYIHDHKK
jgi:sugar-specific transcriptional regulator TrmB